MATFIIPKYISPTSLNVIETCELKFTFNNKSGMACLPDHPNLYVGLVVHECLKQIHLLSIRDENSLKKLWDSEIERVESKLKNEGKTQLLPLRQTSSKNFAVEKDKLSQVIESVRSRPDELKVKKRDCEVQSEKKLFSNDGSITGIPDLVIDCPSFVRIIDYKSGKINDIDGQPSPQHARQLKLYSYLFHENNGKWPDELILTDANRSRTKFVKFTPEECMEEARIAKDVLKRIQNNFKPRPAVGDHCFKCKFRPSCEHHWNLDQTDQLLQAIEGVVCKSLVSVNRENVRVEIENKNGTMIIVFKGPNYSENKFEVGNRVQVYNLLREVGGNRFKSSKWTAIFQS